MNIDLLNNEFYNEHVDSLDKIPFKEILPPLILNYLPKTQIATKTSARTARSVPDTAVGIEEQGSSLAEMHTAVDGALLAVLAERAIP